MNIKIGNMFSSIFVRIKIKNPSKEVREKVVNENINLMIDFICELTEGLPSAYKNIIKCFMKKMFSFDFDFDNDFKKISQYDDLLKRCDELNEKNVELKNQLEQEILKSKDFQQKIVNLIAIANQLKENDYEEC